MCQSKNLLSKKRKREKWFATCKVNIFLLHLKTKSAPSFSWWSIPNIHSEPFYPSRGPSPSPIPEAKQHATPCWAGHIELHYLLLGDETGQLPNPVRSSSGGGLPSPSLAGTPSQWYHPGRWHQSSPFPNCTFPQYCPLVHRAVKAGQVHKLTARGSIRLGEPQVHSVTLLNYFGIKLK